MFTQTIALFRYQWLAVINWKNLLVLCAIYLAAFLVSQFSAQLAIINSPEVALGVLADFLRYCLALFMVISICYQVAQDYELGQFDRLLAMPVSRWQYVLAQFLVVVAIAFFMCLPVLLLLLLTAPLTVATYWSLAVFLELILVGLISMLAILSLEKLPVAIVFSIALYLFSRLAPVIVYIFNQSEMYYQDEKGFQLGNMLMSILQYVLPDLSIFAQNNALFEQAHYFQLLSSQAVSLLVYGCFIFIIILVDFYRKEIRG
jgi:hypothetical protein